MNKASWTDVATRGDAQAQHSVAAKAALRHAFAGPTGDSVDLRRINKNAGPVNGATLCTPFNVVVGHNVAEVIIAKQRHGPIGTVPLQFEGMLTKFSDLLRSDYVPAQME